MKLGFFLASTARGGGTRVFFEYANRLAGQGHDVQVLSFGPAPAWYPLRVAFRQVEDFSEPADPERLWVASHLFLIPLIWMAAPHTRLMWYCQGYDPFANARSFQDSRRDCAQLLEVLRLPFPALAVSRSVQSLLRERGKESICIPYGLDRDRIFPRPRVLSESPKRILVVLDPDIAWKGFDDALAALNLLSFPKTLVMVTRNLRWRPPSLDFPVEIHRCPGLTEIVDIMAGCHALCCASWYDGLPLPPLEAMAIGLPVVCTRSLGIDDYGRDEENLLLADIGRPDQLARQLERVLLDEALSRRLGQAGLDTASHGFDWDESARAFADACQLAPCPGAPEGPDMQTLLKGLEEAGHYTPLDVHKEATRNYRELCQLATAPPSSDRLEQLRQIRERARLRCHQLPIFKAHFDASQLLLAFPNRSIDLAVFRNRICP